MGDGIGLSHFFGQDFFNDAKKEDGQYSITNSLKGPRTVLPGGYLCFRDALGQWNKWVDRGNGPVLERLEGIDDTAYG
jgi:hypothetical protein